MITVHGTYVRADGTPDSGIVILRPAVPGIVDSDIVTTHTVAAELDDTGTFTLQVLDSSDFQTNGPMPYLITEQLAGFRRSWIAELHGPDVDLADLQPLAEAPDVGWVPPAGGGGGASSLDELTDVDVSLSATGMVLIKQLDGTWRGANVRQSLNQLTDVTAPPATPANSLLGTVGEGLTPGVAEWEPLHLDYIQNVVLGPIPSSVADLSQRVTELEHTNEIVPPDLELTVDLYGGSFTRVIGCDPITAAPARRITVALATTPGPNGAVFRGLGDISGTGAVWADFGGTLGKVVDTSGTGVNGAALKEAIRRAQIVTVHRGTDGTHPTLVVEKVENPADAGSSLTLDALRDVTAPASTPAGKVLGTTAVGVWGPVDAATGGGGGPAGVVYPMPNVNRYVGVAFAIPGDTTELQFGSTASNAGEWTMLSPFFVTGSCEFDQLAFTVNSPAVDAGCELHFAIYATDDRGRPSTLVRVLGSAPVTTGGDKNITLSPPLALTTGLYYTASQHRGTGPGASVKVSGLPTALHPAIVQVENHGPRGVGVFGMFNTFAADLSGQNTDCNFGTGLVPRIALRRSK